MKKPIATPAVLDLASLDQIMGGCQAVATPSPAAVPMHFQALAAQPTVAGPSFEGTTKKLDFMVGLGAQVQSFHDTAPAGNPMEIGPSAPTVVETAAEVPEEEQDCAAEDDADACEDDAGEYEDDEAAACGADDEAPEDEGCGDDGDDAEELAAADDENDYQDADEGAGMACGSDGDEVADDAEPAALEGEPEAPVFQCGTMDITADEGGLVGNILALAPEANEIVGNILALAPEANEVVGNILALGAEADAPSGGFQCGTMDTGADDTDAALTPPAKAYAAQAGASTASVWDSAG